MSPRETPEVTDIDDEEQEWRRKSGTGGQTSIAGKTEDPRAYGLRYVPLIRGRRTIPASHDTLE
jgi:hypothetical protein